MAQKKEKKIAFLNVDFFPDDGHLDKGEVILSNPLVSKERQGHGEVQFKHLVCNVYCILHCTQMSQDTF